MSLDADLPPIVAHRRELEDWAARSADQRMLQRSPNHDWRVEDGSPEAEEAMAREGAALRRGELWRRDSEAPHGDPRVQGWREEERFEQALHVEMPPFDAGSAA